MKNVPAGGKASATFILIPLHPGDVKIIAKFNSNELDDVNGFATIQIENNSN